MYRQSMIIIGWRTSASASAPRASRAMHAGEARVRQRDVNPANSPTNKCVRPERGKRPMIAFQPVWIHHPLALRVGVKVAPLRRG